MPLSLASDWKNAVQAPRWSRRFQSEKSNAIFSFFDLASGPGCLTARAAAPRSTTGWPPGAPGWPSSRRRPQEQIRHADDTCTETERGKKKKKEQQNIYFPCEGKKRKTKTKKPQHLSSSWMQ